MLNNISWGSYWTALTVLVIVYYSLVILLFYMHDVRMLFSGRAKLLPVGMTNAEDSNATNPADSDTSSDLPIDVQSFSSEISAYLDQAKYSGAPKEEIIFGTKQILKKYPSLKGSDYREGINHLLVYESKNKCAVDLNNEELRLVWLD